MFLIDTMNEPGQNTTRRLTENCHSETIIY